MSTGIDQLFGGDGAPAGVDVGVKFGL